MFESMYAPTGSVWLLRRLASKRIAVVDVSFREDPKGKIVLVNPRSSRKKASRRQ